MERVASKASVVCTLEKGSLRPQELRQHEAALATQWAAGTWRGETLHTEDGSSYSLLYEGRRGGPAGPDFRDAVLLDTAGMRLYGDVELHLRATGWRAHGHHLDPHYDGIVLHAVLQSSKQAQRTRLANGATAPIVVLHHPRHVPEHIAVDWPCTTLLATAGKAHLNVLLHTAGMARFQQRTTMFQRLLVSDVQIEVAAALALWGKADCLLFLALAEALAYGREREALCAAGRQLLTTRDTATLLTASQRLPRLEQQRITGLAQLFRRWRDVGPWQSLHLLIRQQDAQRANRSVIEALHVAGGTVSPGRAAILTANVVLPFAAAWANVHIDAPLAEQAQAMYVALPGLPSNTITRLMSRQLQLARLPVGAVAQQGLQHLWSTWCREKRCGECPCGENTETSAYSGKANEPSVMPPSTTSTAPVVKFEAGEAR